MGRIKSFQEYGLDEPLKYVNESTGKTSYGCLFCGKCLSSKGGYITHVKLHFEGTSKRYKPKAPKAVEKTIPVEMKLSRQSYYDESLGKTMYKCTYCGKALASQGSYSLHVKAHEGVKAYECDVCEARFVQKGNLISHIRKHTGERPFHCVECKSTFAQQGQLDLHKRIHNGNMPFQCDKCRVRFCQKSQLIKHMNKRNHP